MSEIFDNNADTIGGTPLVKINHISEGNIYAKLENRNPAMSVKCRIGYSMVKAAEEDGSLKPGMTIGEPTSGNTGIALALVAAARGYGCILTMPNTMSLERRMLMKALGAAPVRESGQSGDSRTDHRAGNLGGHRGQNRHPDLRRWHRRHPDGHIALHQGYPGQGDSHCRGRAGLHYHDHRRQGRRGTHPRPA
jgi:cysteine synthase